MMAMMMMITTMTMTMIMIRLTNNIGVHTYSDKHAAIFFNCATAAEERHDKYYATDNNDKNGLMERTNIKRCLSQCTDDDQ